MKPQEPIRKVVSRIIGIGIPKGKWYETLIEEDRLGRIDEHSIKTIMVLLCERLEEYEQREKASIQP